MMVACDMEDEPDDGERGLHADIDSSKASVLIDGKRQPVTFTDGSGKPIGKQSHPTASKKKAPVMSRKLFAFLLSELKTVRLICQRPHCGAVTEMSVEKLADQFGRLNQHETPACPVCRQALNGIGDGGANQIATLAKCVQNLTAASGSVQVEFVLPGDGE